MFYHHYSVKLHDENDAISATEVRATKQASMPSFMKDAVQLACALTAVLSRP
jgi:hypothetical protein